MRRAFTWVGMFVLYYCDWIPGPQKNKMKTLITILLFLTTLTTPFLITYLDSTPFPTFIYLTLRLILLIACLILSCLLFFQLIYKNKRASESMKNIALIFLGLFSLFFSLKASSCSSPKATLLATH